MVRKRGLVDSVQCGACRLSPSPGLVNREYGTFFAQNCWFSNHSFHIYQVAITPLTHRLHCRHYTWVHWLVRNESHSNIPKLQLSVVSGQTLYRVRGWEGQRERNIESSRVNFSMKIWRLSEILKDHYLGRKNRLSWGGRCFLETIWDLVQCSGLRELILGS